MIPLRDVIPSRTTPYITIDWAQDSAGNTGYRCHFWGANEKLVWWTQTYNRKADAEQAVTWMRYWAPTAPLLDRT